MGSLTEYSFELPPDTVKQQLKKSLPCYSHIDQQNPSLTSHGGKLALAAPQSNEVQGISKNQPMDFIWCLQSTWSLLLAFILLAHLPRGCFCLHQLPEVIKNPCSVLPALHQGGFRLVFGY